MATATCLFCTAPVIVGQPCCPALAGVGVAAHRACCGGCTAAGFVRPELAAGDPAAAVSEAVVV